MTCVPGSVAANIGPRAISTVDVRHRPELLPASRARNLFRSAHSGMLIRGGGVKALRTDRSSRSTFPSEVGVWLTEFSEMFLDMIGQDLSHPIGFKTEISSHQSTNTSRPIHPGITNGAERPENYLLRPFNIDQLSCHLLAFQHAHQRQGVLLYPISVGNGGKCTLENFIHKSFRRCLRVIETERCDGVTFWPPFGITPFVTFLIFEPPQTAIFQDGVAGFNINFSTLTNQVTLLFVYGYLLWRDLVQLRKVRLSDKSHELPITLLPRFRSS